MSEFRFEPPAALQRYPAAAAVYPRVLQVAASREASDSSHCWQCVESRSQNALSCTRNHSTVAVPQAHLLPQRDMFRPQFFPLQCT
jgi:hypothetical protein